MPKCDKAKTLYGLGFSAVFTLGLGIVLLCTGYWKSDADQKVISYVYLAGSAVFFGIILLRLCMMSDNPCVKKILIGLHLRDDRNQLDELAVRHASEILRQQCNTHGHRAAVQIVVHTGRQLPPHQQPVCSARRDNLEEAPPPYESVVNKMGGEDGVCSSQIPLSDFQLPPEDEIKEGLPTYEEVIRNAMSAVN